MPEAQQVDYLLRDGAEALANKVRRYWLSCGHEVDVRIEFLAGAGWVIRTDLKSGLPPPSGEDAASAV
jgi:hypothetical protein